MVPPNYPTGGGGGGGAGGGKTGAARWMVVFVTDTSYFGPTAPNSMEHRSNKFN